MQKRGGESTQKKKERLADKLRFPEAEGSLRGGERLLSKKGWWKIVHGEQLICLPACTFGKSRHLSFGYLRRYELKSCGRIQRQELNQFGPQELFPGLSEELGKDGLSGEGGTFICVAIHPNTISSGSGWFRKGQTTSKSAPTRPGFCAKKK